MKTTLPTPYTASFLVADEAVTLMERQQVALVEAWGWQSAPRRRSRYRAALARKLVALARLLAPDVAPPAMAGSGTTH